MKFFSIKYLFIILTCLTIAGCVKDKGFDNNEYGLKDVNNLPSGVGLPESTAPGSIVSFSIDNIETAQTIKAPLVRFFSNGNASANITVQLSVNNALVDLNKYTVLPEAAYQIASLNLTIPAGVDSVRLPIVIPNAKANLDVTKTYAIGFTIASVDGGHTIASNMKNVIVVISIKNEWDGVYSYKGYALRAGDPVLTGNFSGKEMTLVTVGATAVQFGSLALWGNGSSLIAIGEPRLDINNGVPSPYPVTVSSSGGAFNFPGYNNRYDAATKTFYIGFSWGGGPGVRESFDTLTYLRPR